MGKKKEGMRMVRALCFLTALWISALPTPRFNVCPYPLFLSVHAAGNRSEAVSTSTREGRLAVFDDTWSTINERYYDREFHGLDWDAQRTTFRSLAAEANSSQELYALLRRMIASLNDPHTRVFAPEEKFDWWRPRFVSVGLALRDVDGVPTVVQVERGSAPQSAGVRAGDVIETVNGEPALSVVSERLTGSHASIRPSLRFRAFAKLLEGPPETPVAISWRGKDGKEKSARFDRHWEQRELGVRVHREEGGNLVFEIDVFTKATALSFANVLKKKLSGAQGIVLDLRANGGGDAEAMADIASAFLRDGLNLGRFTDRSGVSFTISTHSKSVFMPERIVQTKLPLIVLTSERTSSAAEILAAALKTDGRATLIGTETCGCVLAIRTRHSLPDGGVLDVSELDYQTAAGERLEGQGVRPDETVLLERNDLYSGRDRAMERAIAHLRKLARR